jgi:hypothetical protein
MLRKARWVITTNLLFQISNMEMDLMCHHLTIILQSLVLQQTLLSTMETLLAQEWAPALS